MGHKRLVKADFDAIKVGTKLSEDVERLVEEEKQRVVFDLRKPSKIPKCQICRGKLFFEGFEEGARLFCLNGHQIPVIKQTGYHVFVSRKHFPNLA